MDPNSTDFSVQKDALAKELLGLMIRALEEGKITEDESNKATAFIVERFDQAQDIYYLKTSIERLVANWPCFQPALLLFKTEEAENQDQAQLLAAQKQLEELKQQTI